VDAVAVVVALAVDVADPAAGDRQALDLAVVLDVALGGGRGAADAVRRDQAVEQADRTGDRGRLGDAVPPVVDAVAIAWPVSTTRPERSGEESRARRCWVTASTWPALPRLPLTTVASARALAGASALEAAITGTPTRVARIRRAASGTGRRAGTAGPV
jgi:hypothetical protein